MVVSNNRKWKSSGLSSVKPWSGTGTVILTLATVFNSLKDIGANVLFWNVLDSLGHLELTCGAEIYTENIKPFKFLVGIVGIEKFILFISLQF